MEGPHEPRARRARAARALVWLGLAAALSQARAQASCAGCEAGEYADESGACVRCPDGHTSEAGASACTPCPPGTYAHASQRACVECETIAYQPDAAQTACLLCPQRAYARGGATSLDECRCRESFQKVENSTSGGWACEPCTEGVRCDAPGSTLRHAELLPGFWRASATTPDVQACPRAEWCSGGSAPEAYCAPGHTGPYCATCVEGFYRTSSGACQPCTKPDSSVAGSIAAACLLVLALLGGCSWWATTAGGAARIERAVQHLQRGTPLLERLSVHSRSVYALVQVIAALDLADDLVTLPSLASFVRMLSVVNLDVFEIFGAQCTQVSLEVRFGALCFMPIVALVPVGAYLAVDAVLVRRRLAALASAAKDEEGGSAKLRRARRSVAPSWHKAGLVLMRTALYCSYAVVPSICAMAFRFFDCVLVDTSAAELDGAMFLRHDLDVTCARAASRARWPWLAVSLVAYGVVVPGMLAHSLAPRSGIGLDWLSTGYHKTYVWFEVAETVRKGLIVGLSVIVRSRVLARGGASASQLAASAAVHGGVARLRGARETQLLFACTIQAVHTFLFSQVMPLNTHEAMVVATGTHTALSLLLLLLALLAAAGGGVSAADSATASASAAMRRHTVNAFGIALTAGLVVAAYALVMHRAAVEAARAKKEPLIVITDPGEDLDAEMALLLAKWMQEEGLIDLKAVVANLHPARTRARLVRGVLDALRLQHVPVGVGTDGGTTATADTFSESASNYICPAGSARAAALEPGRALLHRTLSAARDRSITLLCISSLKDAALFLRDNGELCTAKLKRVVIVGGITRESWSESAKGAVRPASREAKRRSYDGGAAGQLRPDNAHNHRFDPAAAAFFYSACQHAGIPTTIVTRHAAYAAPVPRETYDFLAQSGSPIGWRLRKAQRDSIELLWRRACAPPGSELRGDLPVRCTRQWFASTFCVGDIGDRDGSDAIWDLVASFQLYDSVALVAACPPLANYLLTPTTVRIGGVEHKVVGESQDEPGVRSARDLSSFMLTAIADAIGVQAGGGDNAESVIVVLLDTPTASAVPALLLLRALLDLNLLQCDSLLLFRGRARGGAAAAAGEGGSRSAERALLCAEQLGLTTLTHVVTADDDLSFSTRMSAGTRASNVFSTAGSSRNPSRAERTPRASEESLVGSLGGGSVGGSFFGGAGAEGSAARRAALAASIDKKFGRDGVEALASVYEHVGVRARLVVCGALPLALARFAREHALTFREKTESLVALGELMTDAQSKMAGAAAEVAGGPRASNSRHSRHSPARRSDDSQTGSRDSRVSADEDEGMPYLPPSPLKGGARPGSGFGGARARWLGRDTLQLPVPELGGAAAAAAAEQPSPPDSPPAPGARPLTPGRWGCRAPSPLRPSAPFGGGEGGGDGAPPPSSPPPSPPREPSPRRPPPLSPPVARAESHSGACAGGAQPSPLASARSAGSAAAGSARGAAGQRHWMGVSRVVGAAASLAHQHSADGGGSAGADSGRCAQQTRPSEGGLGPRRASIGGISLTPPKLPKRTGIGQMVDATNKRRPRLMQPTADGTSFAAEQAAQSLTQQCAQFGVPMRLVSPAAAAECALPSDLYEQLAAHAGELGRAARSSVYAATTTLWELCQLPPEERRRAQLPTKCDAAWFEGTFFERPGGAETAAGAAPQGAEDAWRLAARLPYTAAATLIAASERLGGHYLREVDAMTLKAARHACLSAREHAEPELRAFLAQMVAKAAVHDLSHYGDEEQPADAPMDEGGAAEAEAGPPQPLPNAERLRSRSGASDALGGGGFAGSGADGTARAASAGTRRRTRHASSMFATDLADLAASFTRRGVARFSSSAEGSSRRSRGRERAAAAGGARRLPESLGLEVRGLGLVRVSDALPAFLGGGGGGGGGARPGALGWLPPALARLSGGGRALSEHADGGGVKGRRGRRRGVDAGRGRGGGGQIEMRDMDNGETSRERFERVRTAARTNAPPPRAAARGARDGHSAEPRVFAIEGHVSRFLEGERKGPEQRGAGGAGGGAGTGPRGRGAAAAAGGAAAEGGGAGARAQQAAPPRERTPDLITRTLHVPGLRRGSRDRGSSANASMAPRSSTSSTVSNSISGNFSAWASGRRQRCDPAAVHPAEEGDSAHGSSCHSRSGGVLLQPPEV